VAEPSGGSGTNAGGNNQLVDRMGTYSWEDNVVENAIGGASNGARGNALFNYAESQTHLDMRRTLEDHADELKGIKEQLSTIRER